MSKMKYILVTGGVISGVGKGIIASSLGVILNSCGIRVSAIKIDPYINIDAGTFSPYEHGEVFVLDDGGEVDLDLGNYERFLGIKLHRKNNITTGKIYQQVIQRERKGDYLGKTVQVVPHITDAIQDWVRDVAEMPVDISNQTPEVCIVELGGTIGDIEGMPFVEAFRQFQFRVKRENFMNVHVSLVPEPKCTGEQKTKPTQNSVRELRGLGLSPDLVFCRSETPINTSVREKISNFCNVSPEQVICVHDVNSTYHVPLLLYEQNVLQFVTQRLQLTATKAASIGLQKWVTLTRRIDRLYETVSIALVGKYVKLGDAYASVVKALQHAAIACDRKLIIKHISSSDLEENTQLEDPVKYHEAWQQLCSSDGVLVPGGFGERGIEGKIEAAGWARRNNKPFLGVCLGMQCAVIEFARNVLKQSDANSMEFNPITTNPVVIEMPEHHTGELGGTMRLGLRTTKFTTKESVLKKLYGVDLVRERHRHRYEVNPLRVAEFENLGFMFVGEDAEEGKRMEIFELKDHQYYVGVQFHPEYISQPLKPSPPYLGLILASVGILTEANIVAARTTSPVMITGHHDHFGAVNGDYSTPSSPATQSSPLLAKQKMTNGHSAGSGAIEVSTESLTEPM